MKKAALAEDSYRDRVLVTPGPRVIGAIDSNAEAAQTAYQNGEGAKYQKRAARVREWSRVSDCW
jgi:hypothetical protein